MLKRTFKRIAKGFVIACYQILAFVLPTNRKVILFESSVGRSYSGNPKYVYEELVRLKLDQQYKCIWILEDMTTPIPGICGKVQRNRLRYFYYLAIAGTWIFDCRQPKYVIKKRQSIFVQTWHGTPLKRLALDMKILQMSGSTDLASYQKNFIRNVRQWDFLLSQNPYSSQILRKAFDFQKTMLEIGYPRNDILFQPNKQDLAVRIKEKLGIPQNKKVILYAPTWRDDLYVYENAYKFTLPFDLSKLFRSVQSEAVIILRMHYLVVDHLDVSEFGGNVFVSDHRHDIQELYLISDILITDYSSVMFDFSITNKPMLFYTFDIEHYRDNVRGFYFDLYKKAPGPIIENQSELEKHLSDILANESPYWEQYGEAYSVFKKEFNHFDDGMASTKVIRCILQASKSKGE